MISTETWIWLEGRDDRLLKWERLRGEWNKRYFDRVQMCTGMAVAQRPFIVTGH